MYKITNEALDLFKKNYRQVVNITFRGKNNRTFTLTEADIRQGGFSIDRYSMSGDTVEVGSAVAAELELTLENNDDRFSDELFEGAELEVKVGIKKWDAYMWENAQVLWIPCGYFTIDDPPRKLASIKLTALDRMVKFDLLLAEAGVFPNTVENLIRVCCNHCGVELATDLSTLPNKGYVVTYTPGENDDDLTYRQVLQWAAEITGTCAFIDWDGKLRMQWYEDTPTTITPAERYDSDMYETDIVITGVQFVDEDNTVYLAGTTDYAFDLTGNKLITHDQKEVVDNLNARLNGFAYRPYSCRIKPMPHLYPMDKITYIDKTGTAHSTIITHATFKMNTSTSIAGKGKTVKRKSYARANPLTRQESVVVDKVKKQSNDTAEKLQQKFTAEQGTLESLIREEIKRATEAEAEIDQTITITKESILKQTSEEISAKVSEAVTDLNGVIESTKESILKQTSEEISAKVSETGGNARSFSWSLTTSGFVLKSSNNTVMEVTSSGLKVTGDITGSTGTIGGFTIGANAFYSDSIIMGKLQTNGQYYPAIGVGSWNSDHTSFTATATMVGDKIVSANATFQTLNVENLSVTDQFSATTLRVGRLLAPSDISNETGIYFGFGAGAASYHAVLSWNGRILWCRIYNSGGNETVLPEAKSFTVHYACIWGGDTTWSFTIPAGSSSASRDTNAFWGISYATFDTTVSDKNRQTYYFSISAAPYTKIITTRGSIVPWSPDEDDLGSGTYYFKIEYFGTSPQILSDREMKQDIVSIPEVYGDIFDKLLPVTFKYKENTSGRTHLGLIAQDLKDAILSAGLTTTEMAAYCEWKDEKDNIGCGIRYEELIALCIYEIQRLKQEVKNLKAGGQT